MKRLFLIPFAIAIFLTGNQVLAVTVGIYEASDSSSISDWITNLGGNINVLEDFESISTGWYDTLDTSVGTFTAGGNVGTGATSYQKNGGGSTAPFFSIRDQAWFGRGNTTNIAGASNYLDSGDITEFSLDLSVSVTNLFFYLQDPSDVSALTTVESESFTHSFSDEANGSLWFVGISSNSDIASVFWSTSSQNDGYGLDDFSTVAPVPVPGTVLLLGTGLIGLVIFKRKNL